MTVKRVALLTLLSVALWATPPAQAQVLGGGKAASDCYLSFEGITETAPGTVACTDGGGCDADGTVNGSCTFAISVCVFGKDPVAGCTPAPVTKLTGAKFLANRPTLPAMAPACGAPNNVVVALRKHGKKPGKKKVMMVATSSGSPKKDPDKFKLVCNPSTGGPVPGDRTFAVSYTPSNPNSSHFFTSYLPGGQPVDSDFAGTLHLTAGTPGADGVATLTLSQDSTVHFKDIGGGAECVKFLVDGSSLCTGAGAPLPCCTGAGTGSCAAQGKIDCDGGALVGTTMTQDSMGAGPNGPTTSTFEQGAPGRPGDGYVHVAAVAVTCAGVLGIPGACPGGLPNSADDCNKPGMVDYSKGFMFDLALTTGTVTATVQNPRQGNPATITRTGQPFDCSAFTGTGGPGVLLTPFILSDVSFGGQTFDTANIMQLAD